MIPVARMGIAGASRGTGALVYLSLPRTSNVLVMLHADGSIGGTTLTDTSSYSRPVVSHGPVLAVGPIPGNPVINFSPADYFAVPARDGLLEEWGRLGTDSFPMTIEGTWFFNQEGFRRFLVGAGRPMWWGFSLSPIGDSLDFHNGSVDPECGLVIPRIHPGETHTIAIQVQGGTHREFHVWIDGAYRGHVVSLSPINRVIGRIGEEAALLVGRSTPTGQFTGTLDEFRVTNELFLPVGSSYSLSTRFSDSDGTIVHVGGTTGVTGFFLAGLFSQEAFGGLNLAGRSSLVGVVSQEGIGLLTLANAGPVLSGVVSAEAFGAFNLSANVSSSGVFTGAVGSPTASWLAGVLNPSFSNVKLLMHAEGTVGSQTYTDSSSYARTMTGNSNLVISSTQAYRGATSLHFGGGINFAVPVSSAVGMGAQEWERMGTDVHPLTLEYAFLLDSGTTGALIGAPGLTGGAFNWLSLILSIAPGSAGITYGYGSTTVTIPFLSTPSSGVFHTVAVQITGSTSHVIGVWLDGVWQGSATNADTISTHTFIDTDLNIGRLSGANQYLGYMDEVRISEEVFLPWAADYTVASGAFPDS